MVDGKDDAEDQPEIIWKQILHEVSNQSERKMSSSKSILVLGDNGSGKSSLVSKLQSAGGRQGDVKNSVSLHYTYIDVDTEEEKIRLGTWILNGDSHFDNLLQHVVTKETVANLTVLLCADMSKPWHLMDTLEHWAHKLHTHITSLQLTAKHINHMERQVQTNFDNYYKEFQRVDDDTLENSTPPHDTGNDDDEQRDEEGDGGSRLIADSMSIPNNMGVPIIVAVTKTDSIAALEKASDYKEEHFDFIQKHVRRFALKHGAATLYTSSKEGTNISLLYKYLKHQLYGVNMHVEPQLVDKCSIFVPCGWDNDNKIAIIDEHEQSLSSEDAYNEHIPKPMVTRPVHQEKEIVAEDEQLFLEGQLNILQRVPVTSSAPNLHQPGGAEHRLSPRAATVGGMGPRGGARLASPQTKGKGEGGKGAMDGGSSETVLANFFNSLLNKTTTGKTGKGTAASNGAQTEGVKRP